MKSAALELKCYHSRERTSNLAALCGTLSNVHSTLVVEHSCATRAG